MNKEKKLALEKLINYPRTEKEYYELLEATGDLKINYRDYLITEPINCDIELERIPEADYELCTALLTMISREGSFVKHQEQGQVNAILSRMIEQL